MVTALLPMKLNSQRVPNKNFRLLGGKPLFAWMLETLNCIEFVDRIVINTDAVAELTGSKEYLNEKVVLRERPNHLCGDEVSMNLVLEDDLREYSSDTFIMTHVTNPFLSAETIRSCFRQYKEGLNHQRDSLFTVDKVQMRFYDEKCDPINHDLNRLEQTQDLVPWFAENSNLYIFCSNSFAKANSRIGINPIFAVTPRLESIDIDTEEDWQLAELLAAGLLCQGHI